MKRVTHQWLTYSFLYLLIAWMPLSHAEEKPLKVVATFSILGDMVKSVGGDRVDVSTLVGPGSDAHAYNPTPADAKAILKADILFVNGWGFEGWLDRLVDASGYKGPLITTTHHMKGLPFELANKDHDEHNDEHGHAHGDIDPHAWQSLAHARIYIQNITAALVNTDPKSKTIYEGNRDAYLKQLSELDTLVSKTLAVLPEDRRTVVTSHDAFRYFADSYGLKFLAPQGLSPEGEASASDVAALIKQIRAENITALFLENIASPRLLEQISAETSVKIGGTLYADGLSKPGGDAGTYLEMMKHNITVVYQNLKP